MYGFVWNYFQKRFFKLYCKIDSFCFIANMFLAKSFDSYSLVYWTKYYTYTLYIELFFLAFKCYLNI